ncbi:MAG: hypothetical protein HYY17_13140 [Planctomycetes bacterium]|nr:hypothetical protein [Planctomycetota bacterium]
MTLTINIFVALLIALGLSVGIFLVGGNHEARAMEALASAEAALATVPDGSSRRSASATASKWDRALAPVWRVLSKRQPAVEQALVRATALRITLSKRMLPLGLFMLTLGVLAGMLRRDRARDLVLYSSVTFSYFGKFMTLCGAAYSVFVALSPFAPPVWTLYPSFGAAAFGAAMYVGSLPPRL